MASSVAFPPPYKGQNDQYPIAVTEPPYCERMWNMWPVGGSVRVRNGNDKFGTISATGNVLNIASYGNTYLFVVHDNAGQMTWVDMTAGGAGTVVYQPAGVTGDDEIHTLFFNNYLFYFGEFSLRPSSLGPQQFDGSTWAASTYTWPSNFNPFGGCVHKNRAYFIDYNKASYGYSGIDSVSGAVTKVDLTSLLTTKGVLYIIRSLSMSENVTQENIAAFIFSNGEVLAYSGSYPDSPTWGQIARFRISNPIYQNSFCDAKGDSFIFTETEILSLRNLFIGGYSQERSEGIGAKIKNRYAQIIAGTRTAGSGYLKLIKGIYDEKRDRLVISFPLWVDPETGLTSGGRNLLLIYDFNIGAWFESFQYGDINYILSGCYFNQMTYLLASTLTTGYIISQESKTDFVDDALASSGTVDIDYQLRTAPLNIPRFGANSIDGVEIIAKSDLYDKTIFQWIADLGRQATEQQYIFETSTDIVRPMANVGINGAAYVQLDLYGNTAASSTEGLEIYAFNVWYNKGQEGSR